jgi:hypothetical protein
VSKKSNARSITVPDFKLYYRAITIKTHIIGTKQKDNQLIRIEDSDIELPYDSVIPFWASTQKNVRQDRVDTPVH